jgi:hypothetical protein
VPSTGVDTFAESSEAMETWAPIIINALVDPMETCTGSAWR